MSAVPKCAPSREPLSPAEIARRAEIAQAAQGGAEHQSEPPIATAAIVTPWPGTSPMDQWTATDGGLRRWRPIIDTIEVIPLPNGERTLRMGGNTCRLSRELAQHLGKLLMGGD